MAKHGTWRTIEAKTIAEGATPTPKKPWQRVSDHTPRKFPWRPLENVIGERTYKVVYVDDRNSPKGKKRVVVPTGVQAVNPARRARKAASNG